MKLSIIVPVYNMAGGNKLRYCLDSLVNQTVADYEIIAVDDASTDESMQILKEYESKYPNDSRMWKIEAFSNMQKKFDSDLVTNIICLGDSFIEM